MDNSIYDSKAIFKCLEKLRLPEHFRRLVLAHMMAFFICVFTEGFRGKTVQICKYGGYHRTTTAYFLNEGRWNDQELKQIYQAAVIRTIWSEAERTGLPIFCIADDSISSRTKPSSQARHPIEAAYFHHSHLKKKQDYGHQFVGVMLSCGSLTLNLETTLYDKSRSKISIVKEIAEILPEPPGSAYFLSDCWYTCNSLIQAFSAKKFKTIGALKSNRIIYPFGVKQNIKQFALDLCAESPYFNNVTVKGRKYYAFRCQCALNGLENAVIVICFPEKAFGCPNAVRAFLSTDTCLSTEEILNIYSQRWEVEVFFRQAKQKLALDKCQIRSATGIQRFWLLLSLAHFFCCIEDGVSHSFEKGYAFFQKQILTERYTYIYDCGVNRVPLGDLLASIA